MHKTKSILTNPYAGLPIGRFYYDLSGFVMTLISAEVKSTRFFKACNKLKLLHAPWRILHVLVREYGGGGGGWGGGCVNMQKHTLQKAATKNQLVLLAEGQGNLSCIVGCFKSGKGSFIESCRAGVS